MDESTWWKTILFCVCSIILMFLSFGTAYLLSEPRVLITLGLILPIGFCIGLMDT